MEQLSTFMNSVKKRAVDFASDEEGAQIVEYGLIIAVVSIALVIALSALFTTANGNNPFTAFITRVANCLTGGIATCV